MVNWDDLKPKTHSLGIAERLPHKQRSVLPVAVAGNNFVQNLITSVFPREVKGEKKNQATLERLGSQDLDQLSIITNAATTQSTSQPGRLVSCWSSPSSMLAQLAESKQNWLKCIDTPCIIDKTHSNIRDTAHWALWLPFYCFKQKPGLSQWLNFIKTWNKKTKQNKPKTITTTINKTPNNQVSMPNVNSNPLGINVGQKHLL